MEGKSASDDRIRMGKCVLGVMLVYEDGVSCSVVGVVGLWRVKSVLVSLSCQGGPCLTLKTLVSWSVGVVAVHPVIISSVLFCLVCRML